MNLSAVSYERSVAVTLWVRYKNAFSGNRVLKIMAAIWVLNIALTSLQWANHTAIKEINIKQLLDEVQHDIMNYQNRGLCYPPKPKAEADNTDTRF